LPYTLIHTRHVPPAAQFLVSLARPPPRSTLFPYTTLFRSQIESQMTDDERFGMIYSVLGAATVIGMKPDSRIPKGVPMSAGYAQDRKSTRLNSSHVKISYAVFCLKTKRSKKRDASGAAGHP